MKIKLITDSACSVPKDIAEKYDIEIVPLGIVFGSEEFKDGVTITTDEFFERQVSGENYPTTSQVNQYEWQDCFNKFLGEYDHLVVMTMSSVMSGTHQSAVNAIKELGADNIHLFDTESVSVPCGLCVYAVAQFMQTCDDIEEIKKVAQNYINRVDVYATFESLKYLKAGGRLSTVSAIIGTMLKVKIILSTKDKVVTGVEKVISSKKAMRRIKEIVEKYHDPSMPMIFAKGTNHEEVVAVMNDYQQSFDLKEALLASIGCTVGTHTGPGSFGVAFFRKEEFRNV
ncbi:MAG: DegV family protein [Bacillota bacterium]